MSIVSGNAKDAAATKSSDSSVFTVENYSKKSQHPQIPMHGIDNVALNMEE